MNNTLPMKKEEGFWNRLKNKFFGIFSSKNAKEQHNFDKHITQPAQQTNTIRNNNANVDFRAELSSAYNEKQRLYEIRKKYEADENYVNQMSDEDIKALTDLYNEETAEIYRKIDIEKKRRARQKPQSGNGGNGGNGGN